LLRLAGSALLELSASVLAISWRCLQTGVVLTLHANGFSKPAAGRQFCEAGFQNSSDKRRAAERRCGHGPPAGSSKRKVFANSGRRKERAQIYAYDRTSRTALAAIVPFGIMYREL
jgi:hypothetical protein